MISREEVRQALTGPIGSIRTPFRRDGTIDFDGLRNTIDFNINAGSKTVLLTAGDSHYFILSDREIGEVTKVAAEHTAGRAMLVAADRHYGTPHAVEFAQYVRALGADVLMVMPPDWGQSFTSETLMDHYSAIAKQIPVMLVTNVFIPRGIEFGINTLQLLVDQVQGIVAVKDDFGGEFARKMALLVHDRWAVFSGGQKQNHLDALSYGCDGYLSTFISFSPEIARYYWEAIEARDLRTARAMIKGYDMPFFDFISTLPGGFDAGMHGAMELFGIAQRWRRKPYYSLNDADMEKLTDFFQKLALL